MSDIIHLLQRIEAGEDGAADRLLPLIYDQLRRLAASKMARERHGLTLQPTALVHEAWLRLGGEQQPSWQNRGHFFAAAAEAMRRILIDRARRHQAAKHGGGQQRVEFQESEIEMTLNDNTRLIALGEALDAFALLEPEKAKLIKLRYFAGLSIEETAGALDISVATAKRWWAYSRAWLFDQMKGGSKK